MIKNNLSKEELKELKEINEKFEKSIYGKQSIFIIKSVRWFDFMALAIAIVYIIESFFGEDSEVYIAISLLAVFISILTMILMAYINSMMAMIYNNFKK